MGNNGQKPEVLVIPCSGMGKVHGLMSREAVYHVTDKLLPQRAGYRLPGPAPRDWRCRDPAEGPAKPPASLWTGRPNSCLQERGAIGREDCQASRSTT